MKMIKKHLKQILGIVFMAFGLTVASQSAWAEIDPILKKAGWDEITFDDQPSNQFTPLDESQPDLWGGVGLESNQSVSIAFFETDADLNKTPFLSWQWRVDTPVIRTDLTQKGGDDRSMVIYVTLPYQP